MRFFLILLPFICSILGYLAAAWLWQAPLIYVPEIRGQSLRDALLIARNAGFSIEMDELPYKGEQRVIDQRPIAGTAVKRKRSIIITVPADHDPVLIPQCVGLYRADAERAIAHISGIHVEWLSIVSDFPEGLVLMQEPGGGTESEKMLCVIAGGGDTRVIVPSFIGLSYEDALYHAAQLGLSLDCTENGLSKTEKYIKKQWPPPGAVVDKGRLTHLFCSVKI